MRAWSLSLVGASVAVGLVFAACSSSDDSSTPTPDASIDATPPELCPANLVLGEQVAPSQYAAGLCTTEAEVCTLSETLCPGHPATFLCECEDGEWTCAIASGSYEDCITNDGGSFDSSIQDDDSAVPGADASDDAGDDASAADAADD